MNRIYRVVWNTALSLWVAVAETAKGKTKGGAGRSALTASASHQSPGFPLHARCRAALIMLLSLAVANQQVHAADAANASLVVGAGTVNTSGNITTINQATQKLAIDWTSLSTRANEALIFNQPNAAAIALNRITGTSPSELLGSLTANGQVFILNPNGVMFGAGSQVNVGGLVASTMNLSNADFAAGNFKFSGSGSGSVVNQGTLTAASGGYLALLAPEVRNEGVMVASLGTALLAAGNKVTLNLDNGSLLGYSIDQGAINALADNKQLIKADGGQVLLSARAMDSLTTATVNNTGIIEAKTLQNKAGRILLMGDMEHGTVNVGGTLDASAPMGSGANASVGGDGGFIETSAAHVNVADSARITTKAASGKTGQWLVDPFDFVVASAGGNITGAALGIQLDNNNVTLNTTSGNSGTNGDLSVNDAVAWSAANTLTLIGERDVNVNANITYSGSGTSGVTVQAVRDINVATNVGITSTGTGALPVVLGGATVGTAAGGNINMASGSSIASNGGDVTFKANAIQLSGATVAAAGGNIAMTASGANAGHSLEIVNNGGTQSNVTTSGAGTIALGGNLTSGGGSATGGSAGGVVITNSNVTAGNGAITVTGDAGWTSGVAQVSSGVRLDSLAKVRGAGAITITGRVGSNSLYDSTGVELGTGSEVSSTGGNVAVTGTLVNPSILGGTGVLVRGKVQSGASSGITITGSATVGGASGTGVRIDTGANLIAGTLGLTIVGTASSSTTATNVIGVAMDNGSINSTGAVAMTGVMGAISGSGQGALVLNYGSINANGANITLRGSGVPAPAPSSSKDVKIAGTSVTSTGGVIQLLGDRIEIQSNVNAGAAGRVVIAPTSTNREITVGGSDETMALNLSASEISNITAGELQIGSATNTGGITIGNSGGPIAPAPSPLPFINLVTARDISQLSGSSLRVSRLNAQGRSVSLQNSGNAFDAISGSASSGSFSVTSGKAGPMAVGSISATGNVTLNAANGSITDGNGAANNITAASLNASSSDGISLDTEVSGLSTLTTTGSAGDIRIATSRALDLNSSSQYQISTAAGSAQNISLSSSASSGITGVNLFAGSSDNVTVTASDASADITQNTALTLGSGSLTLDAGRDIVLSGAITKTAGAASALTLDAGRDIKFNGNVTSTNNALSLTADAARNVEGAGTLNLNGGALDIEAGGSLYRAQIYASSVKLEATAGELTMDSGVDWRGTSFDLKAGTNIRGTDAASSPVYLLVNGGGTGNVTASAGTAGSGSLNVQTFGAVNAMNLTATGGNISAATDSPTSSMALAATSGNITLASNIAAGSLTVDAGGNINAAGAVAVGRFEQLNGNWSQVGAALPLFASTDFRLTGGSFLRALAGTGSSANPYQLFDVYGLQGMGSLSMNNHYVQAAHINAASTLTWNAGQGFRPTGSAATPFTGAFDGQGFDIGGLFVNRPTTDNVGLFAAVDGGSVLNTSIVAATITGRDKVGALAGSASAGSVIENNGVVAAVTGRTGVGGLLGESNADISNSYAEGFVNGDSVVGGLVGGSFAGITNSYSTGQVTAITGTAGGLAGSLNGATVSYTYASGPVSGAAATGGLVGSSSGSTVTDSFWNTTSSGQATSAEGTGKTAAEMKQQATFTNWDIDSVGGTGKTWRIYEGNTGPLLRSFLVARTLADTVVTYNGATQTITEPLLLGTAASARNAGTHASNFYSSQDGFDLIGDGKLIINKASLTLAAVTDTKTYDATTASTAVVSRTGLVGGDTVTASQSFASKNVMGANGSTLSVDAGYTINDGNSGNNYVVTSSGTTSGTINKASLTLAAVTDSKTYDATTGSSAAVSKTGLAGGDTVSAVQSFGSKNVMGSNGSTLSVDAGYTVADGNGGGNYNVTTTTAAGTINKASLTLAAVTDTKTYDATTASSASVMATGLQGSDSVTADQSFGSKNVMGSNGSTLSVDAGYTVADGNGGSNYNVTTTTAAGSINKASLTLAAVTDTKTYDATTASTAAVSQSGLVGSDSVTGLSQSFASKNVMGTGGSTLSVDAGYTVADGNGGGNYNITTTTAAGTINKAALALAAVTDTKTYDATTASTVAVSKTGLLGSDSVTSLSQSFGSKNVMGTGGSTLSVDAGYTVADGNGGGNYNVTTTTAAGTINKASLTLAAVTDTKTYDGTVASSGVVGNSGLAGGDTVTAAQTFGSKNVMGSNGSTLSVAGYTLNDGNSGGNYNVTTTTAAGTINKATLNIAATPDDKVYDGTTLATASYTDNRVAGDVLTYTATANFATKNAGNGIAVTVGGITTSGTDAGNYTVGSTTVVGNTADITPKTLTVTANDDSKMTGTPYSGGNGVSYSGIVAGETVAGVLTGSLAYSGSSQGANTPGEYDITPGGLVANSNYRVNFVDGTLNLESPPAAVSVQLKLLQDIPTLSSFSKDSALFKVQLATDIASALGISAGRVSVVSLGNEGGGGSSGGGAAGGGDSGGSGGSGGSNSPNAAGNALNAAAGE
ncbi:MAG: YDG domain-containing protein [Pseudomonadota bacterium]